MTAAALPAGSPGAPMPTAEIHDAGVQSVTEQLLEHSWEARDRRGSERELAVEATAGALFVLTAGVLLLTHGVGGLRPGLAALLIAVYALVSLIEFPVGAGHVVPTQLVLIPMLMKLPPAVVPCAVMCGLVGGSVLGWALGRVAPRRVLSAVPDAWHAVGAAAVLVAAGSPTIGFATLPLLGAAFAAACIVDLASALARMRVAGVVPDLQVQMRVIGLVWAVDVALAPLGFLAAVATRENDVAILFVLPLVLLLSLLARDRSQRIEQAHRRLKLVERERTRLQSAVRRLGDAFAAKLQVADLLEILLHGSVEALDAAGGRLELDYGPSPLRLAVGAREYVAGLARAAATAPHQVVEAGAWQLWMPVRIAASPQDVTGSLCLVRASRTFEEDEIALISELISKAELAAGEIIAHHAIREQAMTDSLTGLGNRRRLGVDLCRTFEAGVVSGPSLLLLFDLDGFKDYNDTFGHVAGDALLARLGSKLGTAVEGFGRAYRLGGDEFCAHIELHGRDSDMLIRRAAEALTETGPEFAIAASMGAVVLPHEADSPEHALQVADQRMYANKRCRSTAVRSQAGEVLLRALHAKQPELDEHASRVAELSVQVARRLGLSGEALDEVFVAAQLHDVGKVGVPDAILNKPTALSDSEWEFIGNHTILGERILHGAPALRPVARLVRASHERWDGSGYPDRLRSTEIPLGARVVSVCDAYEAMTTDRSYRPGVSHETACEELLRCAGRQFDPSVVQAFLIVVDRGSDEQEPDATQHAAAHVRTLLEAVGEQRS